jgi:hypothetical protein
MPLWRKMAGAMANWAWPEIIDEDSARSAAHLAGGWAAVVAGLTTLLAVISMASETSIMGSGPWSLLDAALFGVVAWRVWCGSRAWAIAGLSLYLLEIGFSLATRGSGVGILTIIIVLALINGVRGTFELHKYVEMRKQQEVMTAAQAMAAAPAGTIYTPQGYMPSTSVPPPPPPDLPK